MLVLEGTDVKTLNRARFIEVLTPLNIVVIVAGGCSMLLMAPLFAASMTEPATLASFFGGDVYKRQNQRHARLLRYRHRNRGGICCRTNANRRAVRSDGAQPVLLLRIEPVPDVRDSLQGADFRHLPPLDYRGVLLRRAGRRGVFGAQPYVCLLYTSLPRAPRLEPSSISAPAEMVGSQSNSTIRAPRPMRTSSPG